MSQGGRAEGMARLRRVIAEIEAEAGPAGERPAQRLSLARHFDKPLLVAQRHTPDGEPSILSIGTAHARFNQERRSACQ